MVAAVVRIIIRYTVVICFLDDAADVYKYQKCWSLPGYFFRNGIGFFCYWESCKILILPSIITAL